MFNWLSTSTWRKERDWASSFVQFSLPLLICTNEAFHLLHVFAEMLMSLRKTTFSALITLQKCRTGMIYNTGAKNPHREEQKDRKLLKLLHMGGLFTAITDLTGFKKKQRVFWHIPSQTRWAGLLLAAGESMLGVNGSWCQLVWAFESVAPLFNLIFCKNPNTSLITRLKAARLAGRMSLLAQFVVFSNLLTLCSECDHGL